MGCRVFSAPHMTIGPFEDWSRVRSPARARRRRKRHPQRISIYYLPDPNLIQTANGDMFGHPATLAKLMAKSAPNTKDQDHG
jgi:hypothetical protein